MMGAGTLGVSRRHWDMTFSDAALTFDYPGAAFAMMAMNGLSALLAALGGVMYILVVVASILFGKKREGGGRPVGADRRGRAGAGADGGRQLRQRRDAPCAGHLRPGQRLLRGLRALLLRQLEVPLRGLAAVVTQRALTGRDGVTAMVADIRLLCSVFKLRIAVAITVSALAGVAVAPGAVPDGWQLAVLAFAVLLSAGSAGAFNQYVERDLDRRMARTRDRPFVTGRYKAGPFWLSHRAWCCWCRGQRAA